VCMFVNKQPEEAQLKLAQFMASFIIEMQAEASMITKLQQEKSLVESGEALKFSTIFIGEFLKKSTAEKLSRALKAGKADRIQTLLPSTKRTPINLFKHFEDAGLPGYSKYLQNQTQDRRIEELGEGIEELMGDIIEMEQTADEIKLLQKQQGLTMKDVVSCVMIKLHEVIELSGKNLAKEYMKYIMSYAELLGYFTKTKAAEQQLMKVMLEHIMEDPDLTMGFMPTCQALYEHDSDVLGEESILEWYEATEQTGDADYAPYLEAMQPFVQWLQETDEGEE